MQRIPEPELMEEEEQVKAYAFADFSDAHNLFVTMYREKFTGEDFNDVFLDLGCGNCDITRRMAKAFPDAGFHALDGSAEMLKVAQQQNYQANLYQRIRLIEGCIPGSELPQQSYQAIISNSLLHHLSDPLVLWETIKEYAKPYANIFVMDLFRPKDESTLNYLTQTYVADEPEVLQRDFSNSLKAAFTREEIIDQLKQCDLPLGVEEITDRHLIIYGQLL